MAFPVRVASSMSLGEKLAIVFFAFLTILTIVVVMAFRERKLGNRLE